MGKSADAFRTISEVADWLEVPAHVLRFWESKFTQVKPVKRAGGRRYYRPADMRLLGGIKTLLHDEGMTIKGVQKLLRDEGVSHVAGLSPPLDEDEGAPSHAPAPEQAPAQVLSFARPETPPDADESETDGTSEPRDAADPDPEATSAPALDLEPAPSPAPQTKPEPEPGSPAALPAAPHLPPLPDLPADPPDNAPAVPGPLTRLATLPRPLPADLADALSALAGRLRDAPAPKA